jgi:PPOX class probable F420-dependent enzyme
VLATIKRDGRPQLSKVLYFLDDDGRCKISVTQTRAKTHNLRRDPRATLMAMSDQWYSYVVVEGTTEFIEGPGVLDELVRYYRRVAGEHPNWDEYREAMVKDQRLLLSISVDRLIY